MLKQEAVEQKLLMRSIVKWISVAVLIGIVVGFLSGLFIKLLNLVMDTTYNSGYILYIIPGVMLLNSLARKYIFPSDIVDNTNSVIDSVHKAKDITWKSTIKSFFLPILTIAGGGSAGQEAPCTDLGAGIGSFFSHLFRFNTEERRRFMICGLSAGFASVFGTPIAAALYAIEVLFIRGSYNIILPAFISSIAAAEVTTFMGIHYFDIAPYVPPLSFSLLIKVIVAGIFFGICTLVALAAFKYSKILSNRYHLWNSVKAILAGSIMLLLSVFFASKLFIGPGTGIIEALLHGENLGGIIFYAFLLKLIFTVLTLNFGGSGGVVTPVLFMGAAAGSLFATFMGYDPAFFAMLGLVCLFSGTLNVPITATILAIELFGPEVAPYAAIAGLICFLMTGHRSIFPSQIIPLEFIHKRKKISSARKITKRR